MTAERRAAGLAAAARVCRRELLAVGEQVAGEGDIVLVAPPAPSTVMLELETAVGEFCVSEAVITTCTVRVNGREGWAAVLGLDRPGALAAALSDATAAEDVDALGERALALEHAALEAHARALARTKVQLG